MKKLPLILIIVSIIALFAQPPAGFAGLVLAAFALFVSRPLAEKNGWRRHAMIGQR